MAKTALDIYVRKHAGSTNIKETQALGTQCVALVKHYAKEVVLVPLWRFWWSARSGWNNFYNTFPADKWERVENDPKNPGQVPNDGDIIFFDTGKYGHTAVVTRAIPGENTLKVFEQNVWDWDGRWDDDKARVSEYSYKNVYGWYSPKNFCMNYRGVSVFFVEQPKNKPQRLGWYWVNSQAIYITPKGRWRWEKDYKALLFHEWTHHIYWSKFSRSDVLVWEQVSRQDENILSFIKKHTPLVYWKNKYLSPGETNESEDFAETLEAFYKNPKKKYNDYRDVKIYAALSLMEKYGYDIRWDIDTF